MLSPPVAALRALELGRWGRDKRSVELVLARGGWRLEVGRKGAIDRVGVRVSAKAKEDERWEGYCGETYNVRVNALNRFLHSRKVEEEPERVLALLSAMLCAA